MRGAKSIHGLEENAANFAVFSLFSHQTSNWHRRCVSSFDSVHQPAAAIGNVRGWQRSTEALRCVGDTCEGNIAAAGHAFFPEETQVMKRSVKFGVAATVVVAVLAMAKASHAQSWGFYVNSPRGSFGATSVGYGGYGHHHGYAAYRGFVGYNPRPAYRVAPIPYCPPPACYAPPACYEPPACYAPPVHHHGHRHHRNARHW
jgi:hypothetical protein